MKQQSYRQALSTTLLLLSVSFGGDYSLNDWRAIYQKPNLSFIFIQGLSFEISEPLDDFRALILRLRSLLGQLMIGDKLKAEVIFYLINVKID